MNERVKSLTAEAKKLSPEDLGDLVDELIVALHQADPGWSKAWADEARRRIDAYDRGEMDSSTLEEVVARHRPEKPST
jgi:Putative addiction module component